MNNIGEFIISSLLLYFMLKNIHTINKNICYFMILLIIIFLSIKSYNVYIKRGDTTSC